MLRKGSIGNRSTTAQTRGYAMSAQTATAPKTAQKAQRELEDLQLVLRARNGSTEALDGLMRKYTGFVRLKASSYFLAGGDGDDLVQEGMIGLYKAVRDFRPDMQTSFRSFAELCVTRQIITAIKTATRFKHSPLNTYVSFSHTPAGQESDGDCTLGDALPGPTSTIPPSVSSRRRSSRASSSASALGSHSSSRRRSASTSRATRTTRWPRTWAVTRRRSTTLSSGSSARSSRTRRHARCSPECTGLGSGFSQTSVLRLQARPKSGVRLEPDPGPQSLQTQSRRRDSNPRPSDYKSLALPAELLRRTRIVDTDSSGDPWSVRTHTEIPLQ